MFKLNDHVVYPAHGVAIIDEVTEKIVGGTSVKFFKLTFIFKDMTILVPVYNIDSIGIRYPSSAKEVESALAELTKKPERKFESIDFTPSGWNRRHKEYQARIQSGNINDVAKIYRDLMFVAQQKDLSFGERTVLLSTEELLSQEIQIVKGLGRDEVIQQVRAPFKYFSFVERTTAQTEVSAQ